MPTATEFLDAPASAGAVVPASGPSAADFLDAPPANRIAGTTSAAGYLDAPPTTPNELPDAHPDAPDWFKQQWDYLKGLPQEINNRLGQGEFGAAANILRGVGWGVNKLYDLANAVMPHGEASDMENTLRAAPSAAADYLDKIREGTGPKTVPGTSIPVGNFKLDPTYQNDLTANITQMVGDLGTTLGFGKIFTVPGAFGLSSGARGQQEAIAAGRPDQADNAFLAQGTIGAIAGAEFPESDVLSSLTRKPVLTEIAKSAAQGSAVVAGQTAASNVAAAALYDPNRPLGQGVAESALAGGIIGGAMRAVPEVITRGGSEPALPKAEDFLDQPLPSIPAAAQAPEVGPNNETPSELPSLPNGKTVTIRAQQMDPATGETTPIDINMPADKAADFVNSRRDAFTGLLKGLDSGNFISSWERHAGDVLSDSDKQEVMALIDQHLRVGETKHEAARLAIEAQLNDSNDQLRSIYNQAGTILPGADQGFPTQRPDDVRPTLPKAEDFLADTGTLRPPSVALSVLPKAEDFLDQPATTAPEVQTPGDATASTPPAPAAPRMISDLDPMNQRALQGALENTGMSPEEVAKVQTVDDAQQILQSATDQRRSAAPNVAPVEPSYRQQQPSIPIEAISPQRPLTEDDLARQQYQQELLANSRESQAGMGAELIDAVQRAGGLPAQDSPHRSAYAGELDSLAEMARDPNRAEPIALNKLFRNSAPSMDELATRLRDQGFPTMRPDDVLTMLDQRLRSGREVYGQPELARTFASGSASPHRRPQKPQPPAPSSPAVQAATAPVRSWWQQRTLGIRKLMAPQTIDAPARKVGNIVRDYNGQLANKIIQADNALSEARKDFDRTPVPKNWTYDPNKPLPRNYAFMAASERGGAGLSLADRALKAQMDGMFAEAVDEVHRVKPTALKSLIQDYFPHIWQDPAAAQRAFASIVGTRPLEGSKGFLKQRTLAYIEDGLKMGLKPISDNPIDMVLTKLHEVHKFVAAQDMLTEAKAIGARKFVYIFEKPPDGWVKIDDPTSTVHGPPFVTVPEAFDAQMKAKTIELLDSLGIKSARVNALGGKRWGTYTEGGAGIKTKFAGPMSVYWHELGHGLQERYGWLDTILRGEDPAGKSNVATELRKLADLRSEGLPPNKSFKSYTRSADEKAAVMLEAYMHAPQRMQDVAPVIYGRVQKFIQAHPELHGIEDIRPSLVLGSSKQQIDVGGMVTLGHYYMPEGAAAVLTNYLSPGLQRFGIVRNIRTATNVLSSAQLGFSAFHAGFTSIDAAVSQFAAGLQHASEGRFGKAIVRIGTAPLAPVMNYYTGKAIQEAMIDPGWGGRLKVLGKEIQLSPEGQARAEDVAQLAVKAGLRATVDPFWKTQVTRNMMRAWHEGGVKGFAGTVLRLPFAVSEQMMRPILEYLVPRQKLGVFAGIANAGMDRLGPNADVHAVRDMLAQAADSTEDRMGQMTYDNMFYNRVVRDAALMGFRSYGWTYGKYRALAGGIADTVQTPGRMAAGGPLLTPRMAYLVALPMMAAGVGSIMNYLMTGQAPQDWRDALMPRTGRLDANGNPQRLSLPTYIKDMLSDWHDFPNMKKMLVSVSHKLNPMISIASDLINNADFMNTKIANEDDPFLKQQADRISFVLKSMVPFSVTGAQRLSESQTTPLMQQILPFFGFVPAKAELSMTPAQIRAAELMHDSLPQGARTADQAARQHLISQLMRDMKEANPNWQSNMQDALRSGQLKPQDIGHLLSSVPLSPMQYQVKKLSAADAMKVWDLANDQERQQIRPIIVNKLAAAKALTPEQWAQYYRVITRP